MNSRKIIIIAITFMILANAAIFGFLFFSDKNQFQTRIVPTDSLNGDLEKMTKQKWQKYSQARRNGLDGSVSGKVGSVGRGKIVLEMVSKVTGKDAEYQIAFNNKKTEFFKLVKTETIYGAGPEGEEIPVDFVEELQSIPASQIATGQEVLVFFPEMVKVDEAKKLFAERVVVLR